MANPEHLAVVRQGAEAIAQWQRAHPRMHLDLTEADLAEANLSGARLRGASLSGADLFWAKLTRADLSRAHLTGANLGAADLIRADLRGANLMVANLMAASLHGAKMTGAALAYTSLGYVDLSQVEGLGDVRHGSGSSVGVDTLILSFRGAGNRLTPDLAAFFRGAGVPKELLDALPAILAEVKYSTCFICYGEPDLEFATKLCEDLEARGVSCWLYDMDATPGEPTWREIGLKRREAERMVVLCSMKALIRDGVLKEIEEQIDEDADKMVPISLDNLWKERGFKVMRGEKDLKPDLLERNYADFANLPYQEAMERLLEGLRRPTPSGT